MTYFILLGLCQISIAFSRHEVLCNKTEFETVYVKHNILMNSSDIAYQKENCSFLENCTYEAYPWLNFGEVGKTHIQIGAWDINKYNGESCWGAYLLLQKDTKNNIKSYMYYGFSANQSGFEFRYNHTFEINEDVTIELIGFPYTVIQEDTYHMPKSECERNARYHAARYYWTEIQKVMHYGCDMYDEKNTQNVAEYICSKLHKNPTDEEIKSSIEKNIYLKECSLSFRLQPSNSDKSNRNIIIIIVASSVTLIIFVISAVLIKKKKGQKKKKVKLNTGNGNTKSIFILYPTGCEHVERFVQFLSLILNSIGHEVKTYLHKQNDVDGSSDGLKSFYMDCIRECDCILVISLDQVNCENKTEDDEYIEAIDAIEKSEKKKLFLTPTDEIKTESNNIIPENLLLYLHLPKDIKQLPKILDSKTPIDVLLKKIEAEKKSLLEEQHPKCYQSKCAKGGIIEVDERAIFPSEISSNCSKERTLSLTSTDAKLKDTELWVMEHKNRTNTQF